MLHLFLLWPAVSLVRQGETAQALSVVLQPGKDRPLDARANAAPPPAHVIRETAKPMVAREPTPQALPETHPQPPGNTPASTAEMALRSETRSASGSAGSRPTAAAPDAGAVPPDADGMRQYRMALAVEARRFKRYPSRALADEIGGTVEVRVSVAAGGQTQEVVLARSSGYDALDDAALDMLRKAAPRTAVPELLRRRSFAISLPVVFDVASE